MAVLDHGELVDRQPVIVVRIIEVEDAHQVAAQRAVGPEVFDGHALNDHAVGRVVVGGQRGPVGPRELAVGFVQRGRRHVRVEPRQRVAQPPRQHDLAVVLALRGRFARRDGRPELHGVAQPIQPGQRGLFDDRFGESGHGLPFFAALRTRYSRSVKPPSFSKAAAWEASWRSNKAVATARSDKRGIGHYFRVGGPGGRCGLRWTVRPAQPVHSVHLVHRVHCLHESP